MSDPVDHIRVFRIPSTGPVEYGLCHTSLERFRAMIGGGWLEAVTIALDITLWCDEEGKLKELPLNVRATRLVRALNPRFTDTIHGPVFLTGAADGSGDTLGINARAKEALELLFSATGSDIVTVYFGGEPE
jgi:hypothetical protein